MDFNDKICFETHSEEGLVPFITDNYNSGWELVTMSYTNDKCDKGYWMVALIFKYVRE